MKIAIIYDSITGNTKKIAEEIKKEIDESNLVYFGEAEKEIEADLYIVGSWTDKGSNTILGYFYCQGKMPMSIRDRYVKLITENPEDKNIQVSIENFDEALLHPNYEDISNVKKWIEGIIN